MSTDTSMIERVARVLEPQAWAALGTGDTLSYRNRRTSSLRKARAAIEAMRPDQMTWAQALERVPTDIMEGAMDADLLHFSKVAYAAGYVDGRRQLMDEALGFPSPPVWTPPHSAAINPSEAS